MEPRLRASPEQFSALIDFMERNGDLSRPQSGPQGRLKGDRMWQELANILNSLGGGVLKSSDKWKKVWADWKTKTKKKYLSLRLEASGTGGGPRSRIALTALEERVVAIIGASAVVGQAGIREHGFNRPTSEPSTQDRIAEEENALVLNDDDLNVTLPTPTSPSLLCGATQPQQPITPNVVTPKLAATTSTVATAPPLSPPTPPPVPQPAPPQHTSPTRNSRRQASASPVSTPRRTLLRARRNRGLTPFERAADQFSAVEQRRVDHEEARDRRLHEREIERLRLEAERLRLEAERLRLEAERIRLEAERIDVAREHIRLLHQLSVLGQRLLDVISQQRPFGSLPSTDPI